MSVTVTRPRLPEWLRKPAIAEDGTMALVDHLKELRYRVIVSALAIVTVMLVSWIFADKMFSIVMWPVLSAKDAYIASHPDADTLISVKDVTGGFMLTLKIGLVGGIILSSPVWMYQLWAFIMPALLEKEKKYAIGFLGAGVPLFLMGVALGYFISPKGFFVMMSFVPPGATNIIDLNNFLSFELRLLLVFGLSFLLPVVLVALNLVGLVKGDQLAKFRIPAIFACFVFGAIATPSTDPFSMIALALPMALMYLASEAICKGNDKRRALNDPLGRTDLTDESE